MSLGISIPIVFKFQLFIFISKEKCFRERTSTFMSAQINSSWNTAKAYFGKLGII